MTDALSDFKVPDRKSFIDFINLLREDLLKDPSTWENTDLTRFLEAIGGFAQDIQGYYDNMNERVNADQPTWQLFADIFKGASVYE